MTPPRLSRAAGDGRAAAPIRLLHLGLGAFFRSHQAWYTDRSSDATEWGIAAFTGRSPDLAATLQDQDGLYTLVTRGAVEDDFEVIGSLSRAHPASDRARWLAYFGDPQICAVTVTITEAGYHRDDRGGLDTASPAVAADIDVLRRDGTGPAGTAGTLGPLSPLGTGPAKLVSGLAARRRSDGGPLAVVSCDNVPGNGDMARRVILDMADAVDPALAEWIADTIAVVGSTVDRITPKPAPDDRSLVTAHTGRDDAAPVVAEPYCEWVLSGDFPRGRPAWESAGAVFTDDLTPFDRRKLWLLNGAHSLLAYTGPLRGHRTVFEAIQDRVCVEWVEEWWDEAMAHLDQPKETLELYTAQLLERFGNPRMQDLLSRIAEDGSQKLPIRLVPVVLAERRAGRLPVGAATTLAGWVCHLRGEGAPVKDVRAQEIVPLADGARSSAVPRVLGVLDPALAGDQALIRLVEDRLRLLEGSAGR